jgi:hypothetical protein
MVEQNPASNLHNSDPNLDLATDQAISSPKAPVILVITRNGRLSDAVTDYALSVADRLSYRLLVVDVDTLPHLGKNEQKKRERAKTIAASMASLREKIGDRDIGVELVAESGSVSKVIHNLCHIVKRVKFAVIDRGIKLEMASVRSPVPIFHVVSDHIHVARSGSRYRQTIDTINFPKSNQKQSRAWLKTLFLGVGIAGLYGILGVYLKTIMDYWTRGGLYAILPPLTAVVFCCLQIAFANAFRNALAATNATQNKNRRYKESKHQPMQRLSADPKHTSSPQTNQ